jgi:hypothetical protein
VTKNEAKRKKIGTGPGKPPLLDAASRQLVADVVRRADRANHPKSMGEVVDTIQELAPGIDRKAARNAYYSTIKPEQVGKLTGCVKSQATTTARSAVTIPRRALQEEQGQVRQSALAIDLVEDHSYINRLFKSDVELNWFYRIFKTHDYFFTRTKNYNCIPKFYHTLTKNPLILFTWALLKKMVKKIKNICCLEYQTRDFAILEKCTTHNPAGGAFFFT